MTSEFGILGKPTILKLKNLILREVEMGFDKKYLGPDGRLQSCTDNGCTRIHYCSCDCDDCHRHNCILVIL